MAATKEQLREVEPPRTFDAPKAAELRPVINAPSPVACSRREMSDDALRVASRVCQVLADNEQIVLVMGLDQRDGSSKLCVDVAVATGIIEEGKVLLLDGNTASPQIHELLDLSSTPGLFDVVEGKASLEEAIRKTDLANLDILPIGTAPGLAAPLFASARFDRLLQTLRGRYRAIFVDGGTRQASEMMVLGAAADAVIIALGAGRWRRTDLQTLKREMRVLNARLLGVVLTDTKGSGG